MFVELVVNRSLLPVLCMHVFGVRVFVRVNCAVSVLVLMLVRNMFVRMRVFHTVVLVRV